MTITIDDPHRTGYAAEVVANTLLALARAEGRALTQMQMHKLVFIAHGFTLALLGRPLMYNTVHAWKNGPVVRKLWQHWGERGTKPIDTNLPVAAGEPDLDADPEVLEVIRSVWNAYGSMDGVELSRLSHTRGSPWAQVYGQPGDLIPNEITREYYTGLARSA
ncbi:type II toxin-antitoxin system antitoxin SocA domain-containing protein [Deinococcus sp.]|uniref:Panacea domain-containing protein n=1 Tax=Deinococcus sp. TaxID=47478 RepID=UPI002869C27D|nr:type II toxin-antitoxin system antitoxin SocA domain-containing protein [Deinococcus sp.]